MYSSSNIIRVIKLRTIRWAGHAARMGGKKRCIQGLVRKPEGKNKSRLKDSIKMTFRKWDVGAWIGLIWRRIGTIGGFL